MAQVQCPQCRANFNAPSNTNVLAWVLGILGLCMVGGFLTIIVCLAAITAIGSNNPEGFEPVPGDLQTKAISVELGESLPDPQADWE